MNEVKKNFSKWMYWFVLAVAIIVVYKFFDNFTNIFGAIGTFFSTIAPFLAGILLAYLLYIPASRIEEGLKKTKNRFLRKRSRGISVLLTIILSILIIIIIVNVILPVVIESVIELVNNFQGYWNTTVEKINDLPENSILKSDKVKDAIKSIGESIQDVDLNEYINPEKITER